MAEDGVQDPNEVLDPKGVAGILKVSTRTVLRLAEKGDLLYFRVGDLWRFQKKDVDAYIERNKQQGKKQDQER